LGCPPIGRLDESILCCHIQKTRGPYIPGFKSRGFTALKGKQGEENEDVDESSWFDDSGNCLSLGES
jgi:hypothetical protein